MATKEEMRSWFETRFETSVDAFFYDTKVIDMQRVAGHIDVRQALVKRFPGAAPEDIEALAEDLDREGTWVDVSSEHAGGADLV